MSKRSYFVEGYGFQVGDVSESNIIKFLKNHIETIIKKWSYVNEEDINALDPDNEELSDYGIEDYLEDNDLDALLDITDKYGDDAFKDTIAEIISSETGIRLYFEEGQGEDGYIGEASILMENGAPWSFNEIEKALTEESFEELLRPYVEELGLEVIDQLEVEYYG